MKIEITKGGVYGANGEVAIGTTFDLKEEPKAWAGRYKVIDVQDKPKAMIVNPELVDLRKQANELGIKYNKNTTAKTLRASIDKRLAE